MNILALIGWLATPRYNCLLLLTTSIVLPSMRRRRRSKSVLRCSDSLEIWSGRKIDRQIVCNVRVELLLSECCFPPNMRYLFVWKSLLEYLWMTQTTNLRLAAASHCLLAGWSVVKCFFVRGKIDSRWITWSTQLERYLTGVWMTLSYSLWLIIFNAVFYLMYITLDHCSGRLCEVKNNIRNE